MEAVQLREESAPYTTSPRLNPKNDFLFKKLFAEEAGKPLLISLLNAILRRDGKARIADVTILENRVLSREWIDDKEASLDVLCETDSSERVNIEMQIRRFKRMDQRSLFYMTRLFADTIGAGQSYIRLKRTIGINLLDHDYLPLGKFHS
ncbi:Rpn family recombination-promoting nuclease/putative transposase, partial [Paenibacillus koleovorans]|uniref:Rpn family recombination-promoting nuclease/putative transposase n=1 Tax=Paenibacillus koleovorans TaxID=121608 RepID=UPI000FD8675C